MATPLLTRPLPLLLAADRFQQCNPCCCHRPRQTHLQLLLLLVVVVQLFQARQA
jgi:hypothetical protein